MRRTVALLFAIVFLAVWGMQVTNAQFDGLPYDPPIVTIVSPSPNEVYREPDVPLNVTVQIRGWIYGNVETIRWLNYSLDGAPFIPMPLIVPSDLTPPYYVYGNAFLTGLSDGMHNLTIYGETAISGLTGDFNATVTFSVDTSTTPVAESFPILFVVAAIAVLIIMIVVALVVYFNKRPTVSSA